MKQAAAWRKRKQRLEQTNFYFSAILETFFNDSIKNSGFRLATYYVFLLMLFTFVSWNTWRTNAYTAGFLK